MTDINNLKQIREIYGATQEQIAQALSVNRVTVANWENGSTMASGANKEKLSLYYGIGPEFFYEKVLNDDAKQLIRETSQKEKSVIERSKGKRNKQEDFQKIFENMSFDKLMFSYMTSMKLLMSFVDEADLDKLRTALEINRKMGNRLETMIKLREDEEEQGAPTLSELFEKFAE